MRNKMGRREGEVWDACDELLGEGSKLTLDFIQNKLQTLSFDRGSPNYIYRYRKTWLEKNGLTLDDLKLLNQHVEREAHLQTTNKPGLPKSLLKSFELFIHEVTQDLDKSYQPKMEELTTLIETTKAHVQQLRDENAVLKAHLNETHLNLEARINQMEQLTQAQADLLQQKLIVEQTVLAREDVIKELKLRHEDQRVQLENHYQRQQQQLETQLQLERKTHQAERDKLLEHQENQRHHYMVDVDQFKTNVEKLKTSLQASHYELKDRDKVIEQLKADNHQLQVSLTELSNAQQANEAKLSDVKQTLTQQLQEQSRAVILTQGKLAQAIENHTNLETQKQQLQEQLIESKTTVALLTEKLTLKGKK